MVRRTSVESAGDSYVHGIDEDFSWDHKMSESNGKKKIVKVVVAIPNEGHTLPEGYDNRMQMCFHLGNLQVLSHLGIHDYDGVRYEFPDDTEFQFYFSSIGRVLTPLARERLTEFAS